jgi:hypothetical protein
MPLVLHRVNGYRGSIADVIEPASDRGEAREIAGSWKVARIEAGLEQT